MWQRVVDVINANWHLLEQFFGKERILRTIEDGPTYVLPEATYAAMERVCGRRAYAPANPLALLLAPKQDRSSWQ